MHYLKQNVRLLLLALGLLILLLGHVLGYWPMRFVQRLDAQLYDKRMEWSMPGGVDARVVIVAVDEKSLASLGRWPWPRHTLAQLVRQLFNHYQIDVLGMDMVFAEPDPNETARLLQQLARTHLQDDAAYQALLPQLLPKLNPDEELAQALRQGRVVLGYYFNQKQNDRSGLLPEPTWAGSALNGVQADWPKQAGYGANLALLQQAAGRAGHFNPLPERDGVMRRVPMLAQWDGKFYESLSLAMVRASLNDPPLQPVIEETGDHQYRRLEGLRIGRHQLPLGPGMTSLSPYRGGDGSFAYVSAVDVLQGRVPAAQLRGRMVLFGATAPGLNDLRVAPMQNAYPGVEMHANLIAGILDQRVPSAPAYLVGAEALLLLLLAGLYTLGLLRLAPLPATLLGAGLMAAVVGANLWLWQQGHVAMPLASSLLLLLSLYVGHMAYGFFFEEQKKRKLVRLFGQYAPPEVVAKMADDPDRYNMDGRYQEVTVLFSDVRGFTSLSEGMEPAELTQMMNLFLTELSQVIRERHLGTIDKYIGDCVMAFWGAPLYDPDHARNAVLAGLEMQKVMQELSAQFQARGWPDLRIGVGINTGRVIVGDMGSRFRKAYTVLGDAVNLASRLEGLTKYYGVGMLVGEWTRKAAPELVYREVDKVRVQGRDEPVAIYEPVAPASAVTAAQQHQIDLFHLALKYYRKQDWDHAELQLLNLQREDAQALYALFLARIAQFRRQPPAADWGGVYDFSSK